VRVRRLCRHPTTNRRPTGSSYLSVGQHRSYVISRQNEVLDAGRQVALAVPGTVPGKAAGSRPDVGRLSRRLRGKKRTASTLGPTDRPTAAVANGRTLLRRQCPSRLPARMFYKQRTAANALHGARSSPRSCVVADTAAAAAAAAACDGRATTSSTVTATTVTSKASMARLNRWPVLVFVDGVCVCVFARARACVRLCRFC
jgi:hypothetical protein